MAGDEIHADLGSTVFMAINIWAANQALGNLARHASITFEEMAHVIAKTTIPFLPVIRHKASNLVETGGIPSLSNQLGSRQNRVGIDIPKDRWQR